MRRRHLIPALAATFGLATGGLAPRLAMPARAASPSTPSDGLGIDGNRLLWAGRRLRLRGADVGDPADWPDADARPALAELKAWRANLVRIAVTPGRWRADGRIVLDRLASHVEAASDAGLFVIIAWEAAGWPDRFMEDRPGNDVAADLARGFWEAAAVRFAGWPGALFELWAEPMQAPDRAADPPVTWRGLWRFYTELTAIIRSFGPVPVIATPDRWGFDLRAIRGTPLSDPRSLYGWRLAPGFVNAERLSWEEALAGLADHHPVLVTGWGFAPEAPPPWQGSQAGFGIPFQERVLDRYRLSWVARGLAPGSPTPLSRAGRLTEHGQQVLRSLAS